MFDTTNAACATADPELFFPETSGVYQKTVEAKALCNTCPISMQCLAEAMTNDYEGIWGGTTYSERRRMRRKTLGEVKVRAPRTERQINAGRLANADRQWYAVEQSKVALIEAVRILGNEVPEETQRLVALRLARPELSIEKLGLLMDPPMSKDIVAGRLRRLPILAKKKVK